ncbi:MAG: acetyl-CoA carboxylase, carboxyltransferase subunit beta [bacterium]|nr:acetyl-CoA carboxylase, carboxyltransferase subunit beta [bacterium]
MIEAFIECPGCKKPLYKEQLKTNMYVCTNCSHHLRIGHKEIIGILFDGKVKEIFKNLKPKDFLKFTDKTPYDKKLKDLKSKTGLSDACIAGCGKINDITVCFAILTFEFLGGSMGAVVGEKVSNTFYYAKENNLPVIVITQSGGARMQEGIISLMQMIKTSQAVFEFKKTNLPYISIMLDPTTGGVTASFAMQGDFLISEPNALIGFAGPRVIRETIKQELPKGFQTSQFLLEHGFLDLVVERKNLKNTVYKILAWVLHKNK